MARVLHLYPALADQIELVFFDGEEAYERFTATDGLYGSRYFARQLATSHQTFRAGILWDMIGDRDLTITLPLDSPSELATGIFNAAGALQLRDHFGYYQSDVLDDHTPLNQAGIPNDRFDRLRLSSLAHRRGHDRQVKRRQSSDRWRGYAPLFGPNDPAMRQPCST